VNASIVVTEEGAVMHTYVILIRGINVGGKNKVPMTSLKKSSKSWDVPRFQRILPVET